MRYAGYVLVRGRLTEPDLYLQYFDEVCERFMRNGNPLLIPETRASASNALMAFGKYAAIAFSPFGIERSVGPDTELAAAYRLISQMAPAVTAPPGKGLDHGDPPEPGRCAEERPAGQLHAATQLRGPRPGCHRA